jgi:hypothetical protein
MAFAAPKGEWDGLDKSALLPHSQGDRQVLIRSVQDRRSLPRLARYQRPTAPMRFELRGATRHRHVDMIRHPCGRGAMRATSRGTMRATSR